MSLRSVLLQLFLWSGWFFLTVWPEWTGARSRPQEVAERSRSHEENVLAYDRFWLNQHVSRDGQLPPILPENPRAGNGISLEEGCDRQVLHPGKAWLYCRSDAWVEPLDHLGAVLKVPFTSPLWPDVGRPPEAAPDDRPLLGPLPPQR